jgi:hypothetical protein
MLSLIVLAFFLVSSRLVGGANEIFLDGFYNTIDTDAVTESRGVYVERTPLRTDTNRYADGLTSASAYSSTSPSFPEYNGAIANTSTRYLRYVKYKESADLQGISLYGEGDSRKEDARFRIISQPGYESLPAPNATFTVYAAIKWNPSDYAIMAGEDYEIEVKGDQSWQDGGMKVGPQGYDSYYDPVSVCYVAMGRCRAHLRKQRRVTSRNPNPPRWMSLACAIAEFVRPLSEIIPGQENAARYLPIDESRAQGTILTVGRKLRFTAVDTGSLICFANDAHSAYWNNIGQLEVRYDTIRAPEPPSPPAPSFNVPPCYETDLIFFYDCPHSPPPLLSISYTSLPKSTESTGFHGISWHIIDR